MAQAMLDERPWVLLWRETSFFLFVILSGVYIVGVGEIGCPKFDSLVRVALGQ